MHDDCCGKLFFLLSVLKQNYVRITYILLLSSYAHHGRNAASTVTKTSPGRLAAHGRRCRVVLGRSIDSKALPWTKHTEENYTYLYSWTGRARLNSYPPLIWGFPKIRGTLLGIPIIRTIIY